MQDLYILGGAQRATFRDAQEEWLLYERALIARFSPGAATGAICCIYDTPSEARPSARSSVLFKSGAIADDRLYVCTSTEVMVFRLPGFHRLAYISLPWFNDLHHVCPAPEGRLAVAVTGLDMVAEITWEGELRRCWSAVGGDPWRRFSRTADYRRVATLKPYEAHVNFVFWAQGLPWASRGDLGDAICLEDPNRRIVLGTRECIHDGWVHNGRIYFTSVDGWLYIVNESTLKIEEQLDLNALNPGGAPGFSWCRGVLPLDATRAWVGFTRIRRTRWQEKVRWIKGMVGANSRPTRLALYDLAARRLLQEINLEALGMHAIFNAVPAPAGMGREAGRAGAMQARRAHRPPARVFPGRKRGWAKPGSRAE